MKQKKTTELAEVSTKYRYVCCTLLVCAIYSRVQIVIRETLIMKKYIK